MASEVLITTIRESFGRLVYTHKTHEKQIEILTSNLTILRWSEVVLISLTAGGAISVLLGTGYWFQLVTAVLASLATAVTIYQMSFDPEHRIQDHRKAARRLWYVREKYINLLADLTDNVVEENEGRRRRDELVKEVQDIYLDAPDTSSKAYLTAQTALKLKEEMTFSDDEIDKFLPAPLRIIK